MNTSLSNYEMALVTNADMLLTKNKTIQKVAELLGGVAEEYRSVFHSVKLLNVNEREAKISRGENYKGLPYVVLDYPRQFDKTDVLAIRSFFWWGNFFSITLQLSGRYKDAYIDHIEKAVSKNLLDGWFVGSSIDPWQHHFEEDNYKAIIHGDKNFEAAIPHLKIAKKIPLEKWDEAETFLKNNFAFLIGILSASGTDAMK